MSIETVRAIMTAVGTEPTAREIADVLWLARHLPAPPAEPSAGRHPPLPPDTRPTTPTVPSEQPPPRPQDPPPAEHDRSRPPSRHSTIQFEDPLPATETETTTNETMALYSAPQILTALGDAAEVRVPEATALGSRLPHHRALRPLKRKVPSRRIDSVDEVATAEAIADQPLETRIWTPVLRPVPEKWLSLTLVIDRGDSMRIWRRLAREIGEMLTESAVFREVSIWQLATGDDGRALVQPASGGPPRTPAELVDPSGRRVIFVLSDCTSSVWHSGAAAKALTMWGVHAAVAILQPLPERMWRRTAAPTIAGTLTSGRPCGPNTELTVSPFDGMQCPPDAVPVPVMEISPQWLARWCRMISGGPAESGAVTFLRTGPPAESRQARPRPLHGPLDRVLRFRAQSSPQAFRLAAYLAMTDPWLPVMRYVQRAMFGDSTPVHLAEVVLGGLLEATDADAGRYRFVDAVADELLNTLSQSETFQVDAVLRRVAAAIDSRIGRTTDAFTALLDGGGRAAMPSDSRRFALVSPEGRRRLRMITRPERSVRSAFSPSTPLRVLDPRLGVVRFTGRISSLVRLRAWCRGQEARAYLVVAPGGHGKTRLAQRILDEQRETGWRGDFLRPGEVPSFLDQPGPALVVIDYAEFRADDVERVLAAAETRRDPTRVLLLARFAGTWWADLKHRFDICRRASVDELNPLFPDLPARASAFDNAINDLSVALSAMPGYVGVNWRQVARTVEPPALSAPGFGSPLNVHLAALVALIRCGLGTAADDVTKPLHLRALAHERRYWQGTATSALIAFASSDLLDTCVAAVAIYGAGTLAEARAVVRHVLAIAQESRTSPLQVVQWLHDLYPGARGEYWGAVEPHPVAEFLIGTAVGNNPELVSTLLPNVASDQARRALETLSRSADRFPQLSGPIATAIAARPERLAPVAANLARSLSGAARAVLTRGLADTLTQPGLDLDVVRHIVDCFDDQSPLVSGDHVDVVAGKVVNYRRLAADRRVYRPQLAQVLGHLVLAQDNAGRAEDAVRTLGEQVGLYDSLADTTRERYAHLLGGNLLVLADRLVDSGRYLEALQFSTRAVAVFRRLVDNGSASHLPDLARALDARAEHLRLLERPREAVSVTVEAVAAWLSLAQQEPAAYRPELAAGLHDEAEAYSAVDQVFNALNAWQQAIEIYRTLVDDGPDRYQPLLADSLLGMAFDLDTAGRTQESTVATAEAVEIYRALAVADPYSFQDLLAIALQQHAVSLDKAGRHQAAVDALAEAVTVLRTLADADPVVHLPDYAGCASSYADALVRGGRRPEAGDAYRVARDGYRRLVGSTPSYLPDLVDVLHRLALNADRMGLAEEAIHAVTELTSLQQQMLAEGLGDATTRSALVGHYDWLARLWDRAGNADQAEQCRQEMSRFSDG